MQTTPSLQIGVLNDLHYDGSVRALNCLYEAVTALSRSQARLLIILGDLIEPNGKINAERLLREVSALCGEFNGTVRYLPGNHDLDHLSKAEFYAALGCPDSTATGRLHCDGCDVICIDGNFSPDGTEYAQGNFNWEAAALPDGQLDWLRKELEEASAPVLLFSHQRIDTDGRYALQNHEAVRSVIQESGKVKVVFQGHQHADDMKQIEGIAYYTLGAHVDDAGPALISLEEKKIRLIRDYAPESSERSVLHSGSTD